jgi:energy-converting hydrogenase Eha subunit E
MPFPLAHPAAVLPFRRYCPRFLSLPALVAGSLAPDLGYFFGPLRLDELSHQLRGSVVFCLPLGILALTLIYGLRSYALRRLPRACQPSFLQLPWPPLGAPGVIVVSLLVGIGTHLFLDSFTHKDGWLVERLPMLQVSLGSIAGRPVRVCSLLWYALSFVGVALVFMAFRNWQSESSPAPAAGSSKARWLGAILVAIAVLPIELAHHLLSKWTSMLAVAGMTLLLLLLILRKSRPAKVTVPR